VSDRGRKHLEELIHVHDAGHRAVLFLHVGRADCHRFRPADEIDPAYGETFRRAIAAGVEVLAYRMRFSPEGVEVAGRLPVVCGSDRTR
jgi:sugar fermentation stimulation protein A